MNAEQANAIPLCIVLKMMGYSPVKQTAFDEFYFSPFRQEKTQSFHVSISKNLWFDFGAGIGGTVIDLIIYYLQSQGEDHTVADALRWLNKMHGSVYPLAAIRYETSPEKPSLELLHVSLLRHPELLDYLKSRGISVSNAKRHLRQTQVLNLNTGKQFFAIGLVNENDGYELRNEFFKGCISPKYISFIRGSSKLVEEVNVFEGMFDYLSALEYYGVSQLTGDTIILNSVSNLPQCYPYIENYTYTTVNAWLDNDKAGKTGADALREFCARAKLCFRTMNNLYEPHKDVNEWHVNQLRFKKQPNGGVT